MARPVGIVGFTKSIGEGSMSEIDAVSILAFSVRGRGGALFGHLYLSIFRYKEYQVSDARWANHI